MKKLDDIPKKPIFKIPEGYFEALPARIQARVSTVPAAASWRPLAGYALKVALPLAIIVTALFFYYRSPATDAAAILATIETQDLIEYLEESDVTTEDVLENLDFNNTDLDAIENQVYDLQIPDNVTQNELNNLSL